MLELMSEVEALLKVDSGRTPTDTIAFVARDPDAASRRLGTVLAITVDALALWIFMSGGSLAVASLLALVGVWLALGATPTRREASPTKRPTVVLTPGGIILRSEEGLRTWRFDEIAEIQCFNLEPHVGLLIVGHKGRPHFIETPAFERGEKLRDLIRQRLADRLTPAQSSSSF